MSITLLSIILFFLICLAAFFSAAETGMMAINRYRLRHLVRLKKHKSAKRVKKLLDRPDRLLGGILIGNTCANIFASAVTTMIAQAYFGEFGIAMMTLLLTFVVLIFAEVTPKTLAAINPERMAFITSMPLMLILKVLYPVIWVTSMISNSLIRLLRVKSRPHGADHLSLDEISTMLRESAKIPLQHQKMLISILDLERITVDDIMIPRNDIVGIDLDMPWDKVVEQLITCQHTRLPVYRTDTDKVIGILHMRDALSLLLNERLNVESLIDVLQPTHYVLEGSSQIKQLMNFQQENTRVGMVVDEYGDILGLITIEDILEEIVGEFTTDFANVSRDIHPQEDGTFFIDGSIPLRKLNRLMGWDFPTHNAKTLSGVIIEYLETIPNSGTCLKIHNHPIEIIKVKDNMIKTARVGLPM